MPKPACLCVLVICLWSLLAKRHFNVTAGDDSQAEATLSSVTENLVYSQPDDHRPLKAEHGRFLLRVVSQTEHLCLF